MKPQAEKRIKTRLVLEAVAEAEKIDVTEEEYKAELQKMADAYSMKLEEMEDMIGEMCIRDRSRCGESKSTGH